INMNFSFQMQLFDLNYYLPIVHTSASSQKEMAYHAYRQNRLYSTHGFCTIVPFSSMRQSLQRQLQSEVILMSRPVPLPGLRTAHLSGKSSGHRSLPARCEAKTLSHGHTGQSLPKHSGPCQRDSRLENLRRLCSRADQYRPTIICRRRLRPGTGANCLCLRFDDNRSLSFGVSMGQVPQKQSCGEASHTPGSPRQYPRCNQHYQRQNPRRERSRQSFLRGRCHLYLRSGLRGFRPSLPDSSGASVLCYSRKKQFHFQAPVLTPSGQINGSTIRSNYYCDWLLYSEGLSRSTQTHSLLRFRNKEAVRVPDQQLHLTRNRYCTVAQMSLAGRGVLQMDQTAPADQGFLRHYQECRENPNLDSHLCIRSRGHC